MRAPLHKVEEKKMQYVIYESAKEIGDAAGKIFVDVVKQKSDAAIGFATGATPLPTYDYMIDEYKKGNVSFKGITTFKLDEYCDIPKDHKSSFYAFMVDNLFSKIDVKPENINFLDGNASDSEAESRRYADAISKAGGIDIQFLGIGRNGHIGFNEPAEAFTDESFKVKLTDSTIEANSVYFSDIAMPRYAITMGIGSIMKARKIVFVATGESKAEAVRDMIKGEVTPKCPASVLQRHGDVTIFLDKAAASLL